MPGLFRLFSKESLYPEQLMADRDAVLARHVVLKELKPLDVDGIWCRSSRHVRAVIVGTDSLSLRIARQIAQTCHYPNFDDEKGCNRTVITIVVLNPECHEDVEAIRESFESITGCLLSECIWRAACYGEEKVEWCGTKTRSFIDLEFEFIGLSESGLSRYIKGQVQDTDAVVSILDSSGKVDNDTISWVEGNMYQYYAINADMLHGSLDDLRIDVGGASYVNMLYEAGTHLEDIFIRDIFKVAAYKTAIESFCLHTSFKKRLSSWNRLNSVVLKVSSLNCADGLDSKIRCAAAGGYAIKQLSGAELECFARSEHTRWNVEKLIAGYRPYTPQERYADELLFADMAALTAERKRLKTAERAHIDICSCNELLRTDLQSYKYDILLTLAAEYIVSGITD